ncbi:YbjP/YqhG family protein [Boseaceae bacterium BT-24-1]|nr:YbjP/YqhG family protein [Boseaceae bacterium BT-24-1]
MRSVLAASGLMLASALGHAAEPTPDATVRKAYEVTQKTLDGGGGEPPWRQPHRDALMSRSLAALFARDDLFQDESGDIGHVGADPFINGQDGELKDLQVGLAGKPSRGRARVVASFRSFGQKMAVRFLMVEEGGGWRIDDIVNRMDGKAYSIRAALSQPYDCGSFMGKPCSR